MTIQMQHFYSHSQTCLLYSNWNCSLSLRNPIPSTYLTDWAHCDSNRTFHFLSLFYLTNEILSFISIQNGSAVVVSPCPLATPTFFFQLPVVFVFLVSVFHSKPSVAHSTSVYLLLKWRQLLPLRPPRHCTMRSPRVTSAHLRSLYFSK